jgi:hypothetical protein
MQEKLEELLRAIGLPVGLAAVLVSLAVYLGLPWEQAIQLFGILTGLPFVIGLIVDLLKLVGVVKPETAGVWSAAFNLISIVGLAILLKYMPSFDVTTWDAQLLELAKSVVLLITWVVQLFATKRAHNFYVHGLGVRSFRFQLSN